MTDSSQAPQPALLHFILVFWRLLALVTFVELMHTRQKPCIRSSSKGSNSLTPQKQSSSLKKVKVHGFATDLSITETGGKSRLQRCRQEGKNATSMVVEDSSVKNQETLFFCSQEEPHAVSGSISGILISSHHKLHHKPTHSRCMKAGDEKRNEEYFRICSLFHHDLFSLAKYWSYSFSWRLNCSHLHEECSVCAGTCCVHPCWEFFLFCFSSNIPSSSFLRSEQLGWSDFLTSCFIISH